MSQKKIGNIEPEVESKHECQEICHLILNVGLPKLTQKMDTQLKTEVEQYVKEHHADHLSWWKTSTEVTTILGYTIFDMPNDLRESVRQHIEANTQDEFINKLKSYVDTKIQVYRDRGLLQE